MSDDLTPGIQQVIPYLAYRDAPAALDFLCKAFGFQERYRLDMDDGRIGHAEIGHGDAVIMLASAYPEMGLDSPCDMPVRYSQLMCYVDDVDVHYEKARAAGATVAAPPADQAHGSRMYRAVDLEGHRWMFATHLRDVPPDEIPRS